MVWKGNRSAAVQLEREGEDFIDRVVEAVRSEPWAVTLLQLAWTAGPVTFVAMQGAYFLGFGTAAPMKNVVFFVAYTVIAGGVGLFARLLYNSTQARRNNAMHSDLSETVDRLPELIFAARDLHLDTLSSEARRGEAARILLRKADLDPESVAVAAEEATGDPGLGRLLARIDLFRRAGLYSRIHELAGSLDDDQQARLAELANTAPDLAAALRERLAGRAPSPDLGVAREPHFIERVFSAMEHEDLSTMTLRDVEELFTLTFELISGREIPVLRFDYKGRSDFAQMVGEVETARNRYRMAQATVYHRLSNLRDHLTARQGRTVTDAVQPDPQAVLEVCQQRIGELTIELEKGLRTPAHQRDQLALGHSAQVLQRAVELAGAVREAARDMRRAYVRFGKALEQWEAKVTSGHRPPRLRLDTRQPGLRLVQTTLRLSDDQKLRIAQRVAAHLRAEGLRAGEHRLVKGRQGAARPIGPQDIKRLAVQMALALEPEIGLSRPDVQRAINSTNATYLSGIELATSAGTKAGWGAAMAQEVQADLAHAAERLALTLVKTYNISLDEATIDFIHEHFGASLERLRTLASSANRGGPAGVSSKQAPAQPALSFATGWRKTLDNAQRAIARVNAKPLAERWIVKESGARMTGTHN